MVEQEERITRRVILVFLLAWLGWMFDAMDSMLYSMAIPMISKDWGVSAAILGLIATIFLLVYALGDLVFGILADRYGRKPMLSLTILIYAAFTGLCGIAKNPTQLAVFRGLTGFGTGGELPVGTTMVAEETPANRRGFFLGALIGGYPVGYLLAALIAATIGANYGWRYMFFVGIAPALLLLFIRRWLPETTRYQEARSRVRHKVGLWTTMRRSPRAFWVALAIAFAYLFMWWGWATWIPQFVVTERGLQIAKGSNLVMLYSAIGIPAYFACGYLSDRLGRKYALVSFMIPAAVLLWVYTYQTTYWGLLVVGLLSSFCIYGGYGIAITYPAELFLTEIRATGHGVVMFIARILAALSPYIIGAVAARSSIASGLPILSGVFLVVAVLTLFLAHETSKRTLEEIQQELTGASAEV